MGAGCMVRGGPETSAPGARNKYVVAWCPFLTDRKAAKLFTTRDEAEKFYKDMGTFNAVCLYGSDCKKLRQHGFWANPGYTWKMIEEAAQKEVSVDGGVWRPRPRDQVPSFLKDHMGKGKYNIAIAGVTKTGKSSLLNEILGSDIATTGSLECTSQPTSYPLPLKDPKGRLQKFMNRLPLIHQRCMRKRLKTVLLWDMPGAGTPAQPSQNYISEKGLSHYDFVIYIMGPTLKEDDVHFLSELNQSGVKYFVVRSMLDLLLLNHFSERENEIGRDMTPQEMHQEAIIKIDSERSRLVKQIEEAQSARGFDGQLYMVAATGKMNKSRYQELFSLVCDIDESQLAIDYMLLHIISDRHCHDLSRFFDRSGYGDAARVAYDWAIASAARWERLAREFNLVTDTDIPPGQDDGGSDQSHDDDNIPMEYRHDIFISYSAVDSQAVADIIASAYRARGVNVFTPEEDERDADGGRVTEDEVRTHVRGSKSILMIISPEFLDSQYYRPEVHEAQLAKQNRSAQVIPCYVGSRYDWELCLAMQDKQDGLHDFIFSEDLGLKDNDIVDGPTCVAHVQRIMSTATAGNPVAYHYQL